MGRLGLQRSPEATVLPFFTHQILEYIAALYLFQVGAQIGGRVAVPSYVAGVATLVAATFSGKPLGGGRLPRPAHRLVDLVLIAFIAAAPFVFGFSENSAALVRLEALALALAGLTFFTNYGPPQGVARDLARGLRQQAARGAGAYVGRRLGRRGGGDAARRTR